MASLVAAGLMPTPTLFLSFDVTFSSCAKGAYSCVGEVMGGEVLWGEVANVFGADACGTLTISSVPAAEKCTYPSGVGIAVPGAWALATPAFDII